VSLRDPLRAPLIAAVAATLISGLLVFAPAAADTAAKPDRRAVSAPATAAAADAGTKAAMVARERRLARKDGLTRSRAVFARSSYLCVGYKACGQAGMGAAGYAAANDKMYWRMYAGHNCTNYAAYRMVRSGLPNQRPWSGGGNATYWGTSVPSLTDKVPAVGAVAWWKANTGPAGSAGHVAYVERVVSADQIVVSQDSWGGDFSWATITKASGNWPSGFIHFNDLKLVNKAAPTVSGVAKVGATLTATAGSWNPTDAKVAYQWYANGVAITSATRSTLALTGALLGKSIKVRTTASKTGFATKAATSAATAAVLPGALASTTAPLISGVAKVDRKLALKEGAWNVKPDSTSIRWYADGALIPNRVGRTLKLTPDLAGRAISASVSANRAYYSSVTATSAATAPVALGTIGSSRAPTLTGTAEPGETLTVDPGAYQPTDATIAVQWLRGGVPVPGAVASTYRLSAADLGAHVAPRITVSRVGYATTTPVAPVSKRVRAQPRIRIERVRLKHGVRLRLSVLTRYVPRVEGTVLVRVQGGFRQTVALRNGVARLRVSGLPKGKRGLKVVYMGSPTVSRVARHSALRMP
jgi:surface antigen